MKVKVFAVLGASALMLICSRVAMAGVSVGFNVGVPAPVYVAPAPVVVAPAPVYTLPPPTIAYQPVPVVAPAIFIGWHGDRYWDGRRWWGRREWYGHRHW
jgi:hypothetical protein